MRARWRWLASREAPVRRSGRALQPAAAAAARFACPALQDGCVMSSADGGHIDFTTSCPLSETVSARRQTDRQISGGAMDTPDGSSFAATTLSEPDPHRLKLVETALEDGRVEIVRQPIIPLQRE